MIVSFEIIQESGRPFNYDTFKARFAEILGSHLASAQYYQIISFKREDLNNGLCCFDISIDDPMGYFRAKKIDFFDMEDVDIELQKRLYSGIYDAYKRRPDITGPSYFVYFR